MAVPYMRIKDSVFHAIGQEQELALSIYQHLHPEDTSVTAADIKNVTLTNVFASGRHNDLGLLVRDRLIILIEAQSTWSFKIGLRILIYLFMYYIIYIKEQEIDMFDDKEDLLPPPDLYVIYTGKRKNVPDSIPVYTLFKGVDSDFLGGLQIKVLRGTDGYSTIDQYCRFCNVYDAEWQKQMPDYREKSKGLGDEDKKELYREALLQIARETIQQCLKEGILTKFLWAHQKEVLRDMDYFFDADWERAVQAKTTQQAEKRAEDAEEQLEQEKEQAAKMKKTLIGNVQTVMEKFGVGLEEAVRMLVPEDLRREYLDYFRGTAQA